MGRFLDELEKGQPKKKGRFLDLVEETTEDTTGAEGTPIPGVKEVKGAVGTAAKAYAPGIGRVADSAAGKFILKGFHLLGRPASETTGAVAGGLLELDKHLPKEGLIKQNTPEAQAKLEEIRAKNLAARAGGDNVFASELLQAGMPAMKVDDSKEKFIPDTVQDIPGSAVGNVKRLGNFLFDVFADPFSYVKGPSLTRQGKVAQQVEAATRAGEKISLDSKLMDDIAALTGEPKSAATIGKARKSGKLGDLGEKLSDRVARGQANILSADIPMTNLEIPLLPRGLQVPIAKGGEAIGSALVNNPIVKPFATELKKLFSTKTGNKEYDKLVQEFNDLVAFRESAKLDQGKELDDRITQLAKRVGKPREEINKMITEAVEVKKGSINPSTVAENQPLPSKYRAAYMADGELVVAPQGGHYTIADQVKDAKEVIDGYVDETGKFVTKVEADPVSRAKYELNNTVIDDVSRGEAGVIEVMSGYSDVPEDVWTDFKILVNGSTDEEVIAMFKDSKQDILDYIREAEGPENSFLKSNVPGMGGYNEPDDIDEVIRRAMDKDFDGPLEPRVGDLNHPADSPEFVGLYNQFLKSTDDDLEASSDQLSRFLDELNDEDFVKMEKEFKGIEGDENTYLRSLIEESKERRLNGPENQRLESKFPDYTQQAYDEAKAEIAEGIKADLIAEAPKSMEGSRGYIAKWINYGKQFNGQGLADNSKLSTPQAKGIIEEIHQIHQRMDAAAPGADGPTLKAMEIEKIQQLLTEVYGVTPQSTPEASLAGKIELMQDFITDHDRLALGNAAARLYHPGSLINTIYPMVGDDLSWAIAKEMGLEGADQLTDDIAQKALSNLFQGRAIKVGDNLYGKNITLLSQQDILQSMIARGSLGETGDTAESLFTQLQRTFPNIFSVGYRFTKVPQKGTAILGWAGVHSRSFFGLPGTDISQITELFKKQQMLTGKLSKELLDKARAMIQLVPAARAMALKHEDAVINALNFRITKRLGDKIQSRLETILKDPTKNIQLRDLLRQYENVKAETLGIVKPSIIGKPIEANLESVASVYSEALTGSFRNSPYDMERLNNLAIDIVREVFEVEPGDLIRNARAFTKTINRNPDKAYKDYIKWIKGHESGHRFLGNYFNDTWSVLPRSMREEYEQIFRNDVIHKAELTDPYDLKSIGENFSNANGFYLTFPQIMQDIMPKKFDFFRRVYTPGQGLEPAQLVSGAEMLRTLERMDPNLSTRLKAARPDLFDGTLPEFYSKSPSGDPGLDSIVKTIKELNKNQILIEQSSGVKITPLASDIDYIAHAMTPEARDVVMDIMKKAGTLPRAITAKEFSTKLANSIRRDFTTVKADVAKKMFEDGSISKKDYKSIMHKDTGLAHLDNMLDDGKITEGQFSELVHSMTVSEINALAAQGKLKITNGQKVAEFFHEDPVYSTTVRGVRGERARTNVEFYEELKGRGIALEKNSAPPDWIEPNIVELEGFKVEPEVAQHLNAYRKSIADPQSPVEFLRLFDQVQDWWKSWTLAIFPTYHSRNFVGNMWNNYLAGVRDPRVYKMASDIQRRSRVVFKDGLGKRWDNDSVLESAKRHGVLDRGWVGSDIQQSVAQALEKPKLLSAGRNSKIIDTGFKVGRSIENNARLGHFIDRLMKGDTAAEAAASVKKYLFDYSELTQFERKVMKRLFPFYTWTRKNLPLQVQHLVTRPARYSIIDKASNQVQTKDKPDEKLLPQWMIENYPQRLRFNKKTGNYEYFLLSSWLPAAEIVKIFDIQDTATGMMTPIAKEALQQMFNYDVFLKRKIENVPGEKVDFLGTRVPARLAHGARVIRLLNEVDKLTRDDTDMVTKILGLTAGKLYPFNEEQAAISRTMEVTGDIADLERAIRRADKAGDQAEVERLVRLIELRAQDAPSGE